MAQTTLLRQFVATGNKTQLVRLLDVFVFGPLMISAAQDQESVYFKNALMLIGIGTIVYNGVNYLTTAQREKAEALAGLGQQIAPDPRVGYRRPR